MAAISFVHAMALALAAYRINGNNYVSTRNWYNGLKINEQPVQVNSLIIKTLRTEPAEQSRITEADWKAAEDMRAHFAGLLFTRLSRNLSDFENGIIEMLDADAVHTIDYGLVAYLPVLYSREISSEAVAAQLANASDELIGQLGEKVQLEVKVVDVKHYKMYNNYKYTCLTADLKIVEFYSTELNKNPTLTIKGRVKSHKKDKHDNNVTQLHYTRLS